MQLLSPIIIHLRHYTLWWLTFIKQNVGNPDRRCRKEPVYKSHTIRSHRIRNARDGVSKANTILVNFHVSPASSSSPCAFAGPYCNPNHQLRQYRRVIYIDPLPLMRITRGILISRPLQGGGLVITDLCGFPGSLEP